MCILHHDDKTSKYPWNPQLYLSQYWGYQLTTSPILTRDDITDSPLTMDWSTAASFPVILGGDYSYILAFDREFPAQVMLKGEGIERCVFWYNKHALRILKYLVLKICTKFIFVHV